MLKSEAIRIAMEQDRTSQRWRRHFMKHESEWVPEFDRHMAEIKDRNVQFWLDRESEQEG